MPESGRYVRTVGHEILKMVVPVKVHVLMGTPAGNQNFVALVSDGMGQTLYPSRDVMKTPARAQ